MAYVSQKYLTSCRVYRRLQILFNFTFVLLSFVNVGKWGSLDSLEAGDREVVDPMNRFRNLCIKGPEVWGPLGDLGMISRDCVGFGFSVQAVLMGESFKGLPSDGVQGLFYSRALPPEEQFLGLFLYFSYYRLQKFKEKITLKEYNKKTVPKKFGTVFLM